MSVDPGAVVPPVDADRAATGFFAAADFEGFLAAGAERLAGALGVVDFFTLAFAIIEIHLLVIVLKQPAPG
jgi:hypothetical protein